jgi:hypothetical protein
MASLVSGTHNVSRLVSQESQGSSSTSVARTTDATLAGRQVDPKNGLSGFSKLGPDPLRKIASYIPQGSDGSYLRVSKAIAHTSDMRKEFLRGRGDLVGRLVVRHLIAFPPELQADLNVIANSITDIKISFADSFIKIGYKAGDHAFKYANHLDAKKIASLFKKIEGVHLQGTYLDNKDVLAITSAFPRIARLSIEDSKSFGDFCVYSNLVQRLSHPCRVKLLNCPITDTGVGHLSGSHVITHLDLIGCGAITKTGVRSLANLHTLQHLRTTHFYDIERAFAHLRAAKPGLITEEVDEGTIKRILHQIFDICEFLNPERILEEISEIVSSIFDRMLVALERGLERVFTNIETLFNTISPLLEYVAGQIENLFNLLERAVEKMLDGAVLIIETLLGIIARLVVGILDQLENIFTILNRTVERTIEDIVRIAESILNLIGHVLENSLEGAGRAIHAAGNGVDRIIDNIERGFSSQELEYT